MIASSIAALIGNYMTTCFVIGLIVAAVQTLRSRHRAGAAPSGLFLNAYLLWAMGIAQSINFVMHSVFGDFAAKTIGWAQSPFQFELALASLGTGVMAIILHGRSTQFRAKVALVVAQLIFGLGAAGGHIYQLVVNNDHAVNNTGLLLFMDIAISLVGLGLVIWHAVTLRSGDHTTDAATAPARDNAERWVTNTLRTGGITSSRVGTRKPVGGRPLASPPQDDIDPGRPLLRVTLRAGSPSACGPVLVAADDGWNGHR